MKIGRHIMCFKDPDDFQTVARFQEVKTLTESHDAELRKCTKEINTILARIEKNSKKRNRQLAILTTPRGLMLAWTEYGAVGPYDDDSVIDKALGFK
jgi:hypothetical protein